MRSLGLIPNRPGPRQRYADRGDSRAVILDRYDTLDQLNQKFPGLVRQEILFTLVSEFYEKRIEVYCIKIDVEVVLVGILVDGDYSSHK